MPTDPVIEDHPRITISDLKSFGLLGSIDSIAYVETSSHKLKLKYISGSSLLEISMLVDDTIVHWLIPIKFKKIGFGFRPYFWCRMGDLACREIHYLRGAWRSRVAFSGQLAAANGSPENRRLRRLDLAYRRLLGLDGRGPARGATRKRIISLLAKEPDLDSRYPEAAVIVSDARNAIVLVRRRQLRVATMSTLMSTANAHQAGGPTEPTALLNIEQWTPWRAAFRDTAPTAVGRVGDYPALDCRFLRKQWKAGGLWAHRVRFPGPTGEMVLFANLRSSHAPYMLVRFAYRTETRVQRIKLTIDPRTGRLYLECPITSSQADVLYFRGGIFASRSAQRLVHKSQRAGKLR